MCACFHCSTVFKDKNLIADVVEEREGETKDGSPEKRKKNYYEPVVDHPNKSTHDKPEINDFVCFLFFIMCIPDKGSTCFKLNIILYYISYYVDISFNIPPKCILDCCFLFWIKCVSDKVR